MSRPEKKGTATRLNRTAHFFGFPALARRGTPKGAGVLMLAVLLPGVASAGRLGGARAAQENGIPTPQAAPHMLRPGYLGVSLRDLDAAEVTRLHLPAANPAAMGAMIVTVDRDAPAWAAGLRPGDVVMELNAQAVQNVEDLRRRLRECPAGELITLRVRRKNEEKSFAAVLGDQEMVAQNALSRHLRPAGNTSAPDSFGLTVSPAASPALPSLGPTASARGMASTLFDALMPGSSYTGLEVDPLTPQLAAFFGVRAQGGLLVTAVSGGSPAAFAGLSAGDVILRAGNKPVATRGALAHALHAGKGNAVPLAILRDHQEIAVSLQPGKRKKL